VLVYSRVSRAEDTNNQIKEKENQVEEKILEQLSPWCFIVASPQGLSFVHNLDHVAEIQIGVGLDSDGDRIYLIMPCAGSERALEDLCAQNGMLKIGPDRSRSYLETHRSGNSALWQRIVEKFSAKE
jgi:hypothetical protein